MSTEILEWIGYIASGIVVLSMAVNSIVKFRWINLTGALLFSIYGFLIGAIPVGVLNGLIVIADAYHLFRIYAQRDVFEILEISPTNRYLLKFLDFHSHDISRFFPGFQYKPGAQTVTYLVLRNMAVAGVFIAHRTDDKTLEVELDYVLPQYRDFKNGKFVYFWLSQKFAENGYAKVWANANSRKYTRYLEKLGFTPTQQHRYLKIIEA